MWTFFICGIVLLLYAWIRFKKRVFYPSIVFCFMWGMNCFMHFLIYAGYINPLTDISTFEYIYMDKYIIYFTVVSIIGFSLAHAIYRKQKNNFKIDSILIDSILNKYRWIMWLNFYGGIFRIIAMVSVVGFSFSNVLDYRLAANAMMLSFHGGLIGWIFRLTAYINMLGIMYVALSGLRAGFSKLDMNYTIKLFVLFAPVQMATGGRLFILYFIIFYFGSFLLGRGIFKQVTSGKWILNEERKSIMKMMMIMMPLVVAISLARGEGGVSGITNYGGSFFDPFSYISDGTMTTDKCMDFFKGGKRLTPVLGTTTFIGTSEPEIDFRYYKHTSNFSSSVYTMIVPLFLDFGYWGSLIIWAFLAFIIESFALTALSKMTLIRFLIYAMLLKICYESILTNPFASNIPFFELIILLTIFYKPLFGFGEAKRLKS